MFLMSGLSKAAPLLAVWLVWAVVGTLVGCQRGDLQIVHRTEPHMGTSVTIKVVTADAGLAQAALDAGFAEVAAMEQMFSSYRTDSDLSRVNRGAGRGPVAVPDGFVALVAAAKGLALESSGAFNPLLGPAIALWGIPHDPHVPGNTALAAIRPLIALDGLSWDEGAGTVTLAHSGMALGLGGIAKGYTADRVVARLKDLHITAGIVAVAGDVRVFGQRPDGTAWRLGLRDPDGGAQPLLRLTVASGAISTSGDYERFFEIDGVRYHHILDPRSLYPARGVRSVTVTAPSGLLADGLATALFVMGSKEGLALVERTNGVEALFVLASGDQMASEGWPNGD